MPSAKKNKQKIHTYLKTARAAELLHVQKHTLLKWSRAGLITSYRFREEVFSHGDWRFKAKDVYQFAGIDYPEKSEHPTKELLKIGKAAYFLDINPDTLRCLERNGNIKPYRVGPRGDRIFEIKDLEGLLFRYK